MTIGDRLRRERTRAGLTQVDLASRLGVSSEYVCRVEHGIRRPSRVLVDRWAIAVGAGPADLVLDGPALFDVTFAVEAGEIDPFTARSVLGHLPIHIRRLASVWPTIDSQAIRLRARGSALPSVIGLVGTDVSGVGILGAPVVKPVEAAAELIAWVRAASEDDARAEVERRLVRAAASGRVSVHAAGRLFVASVVELAADASMRLQELVDGSPLGLFVPTPEPDAV